VTDSIVSSCVCSSLIRKDMATGSTISRTVFEFCWISEQKAGRGRVVAEAASAGAAWSMRLFGGGLVCRRLAACHFGDGAGGFVVGWLAGCNVVGRGSWSLVRGPSSSLAARHWRRGTLVIGGSGGDCYQ